MSTNGPMIASSGYVDLQVNGYAGIDFNGDELTVDAMHDVCHRLRDEGAAGFLPTVITDEVDVMAARLARLAEVRRADPLAREMILGWEKTLEGYKSIESVTIAFLFRPGWPLAKVSPRSDNEAFALRGEFRVLGQEGVGPFCVMHFPTGQRRVEHANHA